MMMKAEMASEIIRSRSQTASTGRAVRDAGVARVGTVWVRVGCGEFPKSGMVSHCITKFPRIAQVACGDFLTPSHHPPELGPGSREFLLQVTKPDRGNLLMLKRALLLAFLF